MPRAFVEKRRYLAVDKSYIMTTFHVPKLWALVMAVLRSFALDKNLKNSDFLLHERNIQLFI